MKEEEYNKCIEAYARLEALLGYSLGVVIVAVAVGAAVLVVWLVMKLI